MNVLLLPAALFVATVSPRVTSTGLAYQAPPECPAEAEFRTAVADRGGGVSLGGSSAEARVVAVTIGRQPEGFGGTFQVRDGRGASNERTVNGASCAEVVDALALVTAIALADGTPEGANAAPSLARTATGQGEGAGTPDAPVKGHDRAAERSEGLRATTRLAPPRAETLQVGAGSLRFDLSRAAMLYAGAASGLVPSVLLPRYALTLSAANFVTTPEGIQRIVGLVYQLHVDLLGRGTYQSLDTRTKIIGASFGVDFCQSPHYDSQGFVLLLCGEYGGGYLNLETEELDGTKKHSKNVGFGQVSAVADLAYNLGGGFSLGARIGGSFTFGDITAERADGSLIFSSSRWSAYGMLGAGYRF